MDMVKMFLEGMASRPAEILSFEKADWRNPYYVAGFVDCDEKIKQLLVYKSDKNYSKLKQAVSAKAQDLELNHYSGTVQKTGLNSDIFLDFKPYERMGEGIPKSDFVQSRNQWKKAVGGLDRDSAKLLWAYTDNGSAHLDAISGRKHYMLNIHEDGRYNLDSELNKTLFIWGVDKPTSMSAFVEGLIEGLK